MRIDFLNPNSTAAMTDGIVAVARAALPGHDLRGWTSPGGPPAIQGPADGAMAVPFLLEGLATVAGQGAGAAVIACFDDTGLEAAKAASPIPVIGIGEAAYTTAALLGQRFSVVTTLAVSVPVIEGNLRRSGHGGACARVRASGLPVLAVDAGGPAVLQQLGAEIDRAAAQDGIGAVVLGCAGMAPMRASLQRGRSVRIIDGVRAAAHLALAAAAIADAEPVAMAADPA